MVKKKRIRPARGVAHSPGSSGPGKGRDTVAAAREGLLQQAMALQQQGNHSEALRLLQQLAGRADRDPVFLNKLGYLAHQLGQTARAVQLLQRATEIEPVAPFFNNLGLMQEKLGALDGAAQSYARALALEPEFATAHYNLGNVLQRKTLLPEAVAQYRRAIALKPDYVAAHINLANALQRLGAFAEAEDACLAALRLEPANAQAISIWCKLVFLREEPARVLEACGKALAPLRKKGPAYAEIGNVLASLGMKSEANAAYRLALIDADKPGLIYYRMALLRKFGGAEPEIQEMEKMYASRGDLTNRTFHCFALGKAYEDTGEFRRAFQFIAEGNRLVRGVYAYSIEEDRAFFQELQSFFTPQLFQRAGDCGHADPTPIFVVGMPRSGTTLVEQILASHSQVYGAGELFELDRIIRATLVGQDGRFSLATLKGLTPETFRAMGKEYVSSLRQVGGDTLRIVDKMPHNFLWIGLIRLALPAARIIHCRRDPMDTCWSIFKNVFDVPHRYAQDLEELGQYYRLYQGLMDHWRRVLGEGILDLDYERLIGNQEEETRRLLAFCGLPWEEGCLRFHAAGRKVLTSNLSQVREPIYGSSVRKWQPFADELQPLAAILDNTVR